MIQALQLSKRFDQHLALDLPDLHIPKGRFLGVLGRNGAGKTTLVRLLTGQMKACSGAIRIAGMDAGPRPLALRQRMGVMPEASALMDGLSGFQYLGFVGRLHGLATSTLKSRIQELESLLEITFKGKAISDYSFGMKKKTALAAALLHGPDVLFLDEPFEGLDPVSCSAVQSLLEGLHQKGCTILLTSHLLGMAERLCDHFLLLHEGRTLAEGSRHELLSGAESLESLFLRLVEGNKAGKLTWM